MARARRQPAADPPEENGQGLDAQVAAGGMAKLTVRVLEGSTVKDENDEQHGEGDEFEVDGLTAVALAQAGHVEITGTAS